MPFRTTFFLLFVDFVASLRTILLKNYNFPSSFWQREHQIQDISKMASAKDYVYLMYDCWNHHFIYGNHQRWWPRWLYNGGVTSGLTRIERETFSDATCLCGLLTYKMKGSGKSGGVRHRSARAKAVFHPVSRQTAQTSGRRKRLPFSTRVITPLLSHLGWYPPPSRSKTSQKQSGDGALHLSLP